MLSSARLRLLPAELQTFLASRPVPVRRLYSAYALAPDQNASTLSAESSQSAKGKGKARTLEADADEDLFEPLNQEYRDASTKLVTHSSYSSTQESDLDQVLALLEAGQEAQAAVLLQHRDIPTDPAFEPIAASFLVNGNVQAFLRWWAYTPDSQGIQGLKTEDSARLKEDVHALERQLLAQPNSGDRLNILEQFALLAAAKGKASYVTWTLQELAMFLPRGELQPWFQKFRATLMKRADALAAGKWESAGAYRSQARIFCDHVQSRLIARRARAGFPVEAVQWLLETKRPGPGSLQARLLVDTIMSVYHSTEYALNNLPPQSPTAITLSELRPQLRALVKMHAPQKLLAFEAAEQATALVVPDAPALSLSKSNSAALDQIDSFGKTLMKNLSLSQAKESLQQALRWGGLARISASTLAGYIHIHRRFLGSPNDKVSPATMRPWEELGLADLHPKNSTAAKTLWISAFMLFHLRHTSAEQAIEMFSEHCMPLGAPSLLTISMRQQSAQSGNRDLIWPSRFTLAILWKALVEQSTLAATDDQSRRVALEELYESFLNTYYGSQACPIELRPDVVTFQPFLDAFSRQGLPYRCLEVMMDMRNQGIKADDRSWVPTMAALAKQPDPKTVFAILNKMENATASVSTDLIRQDDSLMYLLQDAPPLPNIGLYTAVIKGFSMACLPALARQVQVRLEARMTSEEMEWHWTRNSKLRAAIEHLEATERKERGSIVKGTFHSLA